MFPEWTVRDVPGIYRVGGGGSDSDPRGACTPNGFQDRLYNTHNLTIYKRVRFYAGIGIVRYRVVS
jgi:hypothetical protein